MLKLILFFKRYYFCYTAFGIILMVVYLKEDTKFASEKFICQPIYLRPLCIEPIKWNETDSHKSKEHMLFVFILTWSQ